MKMLSKGRQLVLIGAGHMGRALLEIWIKKKVLSPRQMTVVVRDVKKHQALARRGVRVTNNLASAVRQAAVVVLAVRPQQSAEVLAQLKTALPAQALLLSIMAGVPIARLRTATGCRRVIRAMPNTPAQVGQGMTTWFAPTACRAADLRFTQQLFSACGVALRVVGEQWIDKATVIASCGPAYFFLLTEILEQGARRFGFTPDVAASLSREASIGAAALLANSKETPTALRLALASKGGITEATIKHLLRQRVPQTFFAAFQVGLKRSQQLARSAKGKK